MAGPGGSALAQKGGTDTEIEIGNTTAHSGPASALGTIGRTIAAYWDMVKEKGGINGCRINFIRLDFVGNDLGSGSRAALAEAPK